MNRFPIDDFRLTVRRLHSIDLARGIAVVLMIATHTTDAFLSDLWKSNEIWYKANILFGFVAPAFVFLGGLTLWPALLRRAENHQGQGAIVRRYLLILLLGYWLQTPVLSLRQLIYNQRPHELARMFDANVLQVIAISGLLLLSVTAILRSPAWTRIIALVLGMAAVIIAPFLWNSGLHHSLPLVIRYYLAPQPHATFPLIPYFAYFAFGFAAAPLLINAGKKPVHCIAWMCAGILLVAVAFIFDPLLTAIPPHNEFWGPGAQQVLFRLGGVILLAAGSFLVAGRLAGLEHSTANLEAGNLEAGNSTRAAGSIPRLEWLLLLGRRSLAVYVLHLMLIYGSPMNMGMRYWYSGMLNGTLNPIATIVLSITILLLCYWSLRAWDLLRARSPITARWLVWLWWGTFLGFFALTP